MKFTVIGHFDEDTDSFVEHVEADTVQAAIDNARLLDPDRQLAEIVAVFAGYLEDIGPASSFSKLTYR